MDDGVRRKHNRTLVPFARSLRKTMTKEERRLWYTFLRFYPVRFYKQKVLGQYIADFYCAKARLVVELDGSQHFEDKNVCSDIERTAFLERYEIFVLRFTNLEVAEKFQDVCEKIDYVVKARMNNPSVTP